MKTSETEWIGCALSAIGTAMQPDELLRIISIILTCIATLVTIAFNLWKWYKSAKADGKITKEEIEEGIDIVKDGVEELVDKTKGEDK